MNLEIFDHSQNYTAQVIKLPVKEPVVGLDNLVKVEVFGNSCLVSKDAPEDELYLFFPAGTRLSEIALYKNNLFRDFQMNCDQTKKGFFELNGRVKAIKFKGIISSGFVVALQEFFDNIESGSGPKFNEEKLKVGDEFNSIDGIEICRKYFIQPTTNPALKGDKQSKINNRLLDLMVPNQFRFHVETAHLAKNFEKLRLNDTIVITDKWHGSSCILSKVLISKKLNLWQKFLNKIGGKIPTKAYGYIYSSGKPKSNLPKGIEGEWINDGTDYYLSNIWKNAFDDFKTTLEDGITLYGELVGFTESGQYIQKDYDYGCDPEGAKYDTKDHYKFVVYRITYTKPNGEVIEFNWNQIQNYCRKYSLETVKEIYSGSVHGFLKNTLCLRYRNTNIPDSEVVFLALTDWVEHIGNCVYCVSKVPNEGVVLRVDNAPTYEVYKVKSKNFLKKESDDLDKEIVSLEDQA